MRDIHIFMRLSGGIFAFVFAILCGMLQATAEAKACLNGLKPLLVAGGFSGSVDCLHDRLSVSEIGRLRTLEHDFTVYDYRYELARVCDGCARHGGQRILIFDHGRYRGQYKPDGQRVTLEGGALLFWPTSAGGLSREPVAVRATDRGFPKEILVDGEMLSLFR